MKNRINLGRPFIQRFRIFLFLAIICGFFSFYTGFFLLKVKVYWTVETIKTIYLSDLSNSLETWVYSSLFFIGFGLILFELIIQIILKYKKISLFTNDVLKSNIELSIVLPLVSIFLLYVLFPGNNPYSTYPLKHCCMCYIPFYYSSEFYFYIHTGFIFGLLMPIFVLIDFFYNYPSLKCAENNLNL